MQETQETHFIPGSGRPPGGGHGNPLQCSCLGNPTGRGAWRSTVHRVEKSRTWLSMHEQWAVWSIINQCMKLCMDRMMCAEIVKCTPMSISSRETNRTLLRPEVPCEPDHISPSCRTALIEHYSKFCIKNTSVFLCSFSSLMNIPVNSSSVLSILWLDIHS